MSSLAGSGGDHAVPLFGDNRFSPVAGISVALTVHPCRELRELPLFPLESPAESEGDG